MRSAADPVHRTTPWYNSPVASCGASAGLRLVPCLRRSATETEFSPESFQREDEEDDRKFYESPRMVVHIDESAIAAVSRLFQQHIPANAVVLDRSEAGLVLAGAAAAVVLVAGLAYKRGRQSAYAPV